MARCEYVICLDVLYEADDWEDAKTQAKRIVKFLALPHDDPRVELPKVNHIYPSGEPESME